MREREGESKINIQHTHTGDVSAVLLSIEQVNLCAKIQLERLLCNSIEENRGRENVSVVEEEKVSSHMTV